MECQGCDLPLTDQDEKYCPNEYEREYFDKDGPFCWVCYYRAISPEGSIMAERIKLIDAVEAMKTALYDALRESPILRWIMK